MTPSSTDPFDKWIITNTHFPLSCPLRIQNPSCGACIYPHEILINHDTGQLKSDIAPAIYNEFGVVIIMILVQKSITMRYNRVTLDGV